MIASGDAIYFFYWDFLNEYSTGLECGHEFACEVAAEFAVDKYFVDVASGFGSFYDGTYAIDIVGFFEHFSVWC